MPFMIRLNREVLWVGDLVTTFISRYIDIFRRNVMPVPTVSVATAEDHSGGGFTADGAALTIAEPVVAGAAAALSAGALDMAIADDGGVQTDETVAANNGTANDMTLLPATPAVNDAYYFGDGDMFDWLSLNIGTAGAGTWSGAWEYWNGSNYVALTGVYDTSNGFRASGNQSVAFVRPGDWQTSTILLNDLYWIRYRITSYTSITTQPKGTQAWVGVHP